MPVATFPNLDSLLDVPVSISVQLGTATRVLKDILDLKIGSVLLLDCEASDPVSVYANRSLFASGEIITVDEKLGIQVSNVISGQKRGLVEETSGFSAANPTDQL